MICPACCSQDCVSCKGSAHCFCQHQASPIPVPWQDTDQRHADNVRSVIGEGHQRADPTADRDEFP